MKIKRSHILFIVLGLCIIAIPFRSALRPRLIAAIQILRGKKTVSDRVEQYGEAVRMRLAPDFERIGIAYPPERIVFVGLKQEGLFEVWVSEDEAPHKLLKTYPILAMSGALGPKSREGDRQVPEGLYRIESLNPNSMFHLALRIDYPNHFDTMTGERNGVSDLGKDIMIHGKSSSVGCLAMGDEAAEDLFVLVAETGIDNISVILSPIDFRVRGLPADMPGLLAHTEKLYENIRMELVKLRKKE